MLTGNQNSASCANFIGRATLLSFEETLGRPRLSDLFKAAELPDLPQAIPPNDSSVEFPLSWAACLQSSLEETYGENGGKGVALRVGRSLFNHLLRREDPPLGLTDLSYRTLPPAQKLSQGLAILADYFTRFSDLTVSFHPGADHYDWQIDACPTHCALRGEATIGHIFAGFLQEALTWISGGKYFQVDIAEEASAGHGTCRMHISRQPVNL